MRTLSLYNLLIIVVGQWCVLQLPGIYPQFDTTTFLYGNLQAIAILFVYNMIKKYTRLLW